MIHPSLFQLCVCGHQKRDHIKREGACRPGWMCESGCVEFYAQSSIEEREKAIEDWKRAVEDQTPISGPRSATEATELHDVVKLEKWQLDAMKALRLGYQPTNLEVANWINKAMEDIIRPRTRIDVSAMTEKEFEQFLMDMMGQEWEY